MNRARFVSPAVLVWMLAVPAAFGQNLTGSISGTVQDEQSLALPGVTVTLTGDRGPATAITDERGVYRFPTVDPGPYVLRVELPGFQPASTEGIVISIGTQLTFDYILKVGTVAETVQVVGEAQAVDVTSSGTSNTLSSELLFNVPLSRRAQDILNYAPAINDDAGYGGSDGSNALYLDGLDTRSPSTGDQYVYVNYNIIDEVQIEGLGAAAEYGGFTGAIVNTITKSGGNSFSALFDVQWSNGDYAGDNITPEIAAANPSLALPEKTTKYLDLTGQLGGPIIKDKLFFFTSFQRYQLAYDPAGPRTRNDEVTPRVTGKITWRASTNDQFTFNFQGEDYNRVGLSNGLAGRLATTDALSRREDSQDRLGNVQWRHIFGSSTLADVKYVAWSAYDYLDPQVAEPIHFDGATGGYSGGGGYTSYFDRSRYQLNASLSKYASNFAGSHDFKFGVQIERSRVRDRSDYIGLYYYDYGGAPYYAYAYSYDQTGDNHRESVFAQDSWKPNSRLTINAGLRFDWVRGIDPTRSQKVFDTKSLAPRIGVAFDLTGNRDTVLRAYYGQLYEGVFQTYYFRLLPGLGDHITYDMTSGVPIEVDRVPGGDVYRLDPDIRQPRVDEWLVGFERSLSRDVTLAITGVWRDNKDFVGSINPSGRWSPTTVTNGISNSPLTVYNWANRDVSGDDLLITNPDGYRFLDPDGNLLGVVEASRRYRALMVVLSKRLSSRWQAQASYVYARNRGSVDPFTTEAVGYGRQFENPNLGLVNIVGRFENDRPHEFKLLASYDIPVIDLTVSGYYRAISGWRYAPFERFSSDEIDYPLSSGREPWLETLGSRGLDTESILDFRLEKEFNIGPDGDRISLYADTVNLFNSSLVNDVNHRYPSVDIEGFDVAFAGPTSVVPPRQLTLGVRWSF